MTTTENGGRLDERLTDVPDGELELLGPGDHPVPAESVPMVSRSVRMPLDLYEWMQAEAKRRGFDAWSEFARSLMETARRPSTEPVIPVSELEELIQKHAA